MNILQNLGSKSNQRVLFVCLVILIAASFIISWFKNEINPDTSYYIGVSKLILEGKVPLLDFQLVYTPLSFYLMCLPVSVLGTSYYSALSVMYALHLVNAVLLFKILRQQGITASISRLIAVFFLYIVFLFDGKNYVLEPFVLFFGLSALILLFRSKKHYILTGFLCFCACWSKQYGVGFIALVCAYIFFQTWSVKQSIKPICKTLIGFVLGLCIFLAVIKIHGAELSSISSFSGSSYQRVGFFGLLVGCYILLQRLPLILVVPTALVLKFKQLCHNPFFLMSLCGVFGFMLQCYVRHYSHYIMLAIPFCIFLIVSSLISLRDNKILKNKIIQIVLLILTAIPVCLVIDQDVKLLQSDKRAIQQENADNISKYIPAGSKNVFAIFDVLPEAYLLNYQPPCLKKYGMSNGFMTQPEELLELCSDAQYCIMSIEDWSNISGSENELHSYLSQNFDMTTVCNKSGQATNYIFKRK